MGEASERWGLDGVAALQVDLARDPNPEWLTRVSWKDQDLLETTSSMALSEQGSLSDNNRRYSVQQADEALQRAVLRARSADPIDTAQESARDEILETASRVCEILEQEPYFLTSTAKLKLDAFQAERRRVAAEEATREATIKREQLRSEIGRLLGEADGRQKSLQALDQEIKRLDGDRKRLTRLVRSWASRRASNQYVLLLRRRRWAATWASLTWVVLTITLFVVAGLALAPEAGGRAEAFIESLAAGDSILQGLASSLIRPDGSSALAGMALVAMTLAAGTWTARKFTTARNVALTVRDLELRFALRQQLAEVRSGDVDKSAAELANFVETRTEQVILVSAPPQRSRSFRRLVAEPSPGQPQELPD